MSERAVTTKAIVCDECGKPQETIPVLIPIAPQGKAAVRVILEWPSGSDICAPCQLKALAAAARQVGARKPRGKAGQKAKGIVPSQDTPPSPSTSNVFTPALPPSTSASNVFTLPALPPSVPQVAEEPASVATTEPLSVASRTAAVPPTVAPEFGVSEAPGPAPVKTQGEDGHPRVEHGAGRGKRGRRRKAVPARGKDYQAAEAPGAAVPAAPGDAWKPEVGKFAFSPMYPSGNVTVTQLVGNAATVRRTDGTTENIGVGWLTAPSPEPTGGRR